MKTNGLPSATGILLVILLGAFGFLGSVYFISSDLKTNVYHVEHWAITDSLQDKSCKLVTVDTLRVVIHPQSMDISKAFKLPHPDRTINYGRVYLAYNTSLLVWIALISVTVGSSLALLPILVYTCISLYRGFKLKLRDFLIALITTIVLGVLMVLTNQNSHVLMLFDVMNRSEIIMKHVGCLFVLIVIGLVGGLAAMCGQLLINQAIDKLPEDINDLSESKKRSETINDFLLLRSKLKFLLSVDAALIVLAILTTDALRRAIGTEMTVIGTNKLNILPKEFTYLYGINFTLFLALLYMPVYYRLRNKGVEMVRNLAHDVDGEKMRAQFLINETPLESFKVALSILAPVVSALLPGIIKI